MSGIFKDPRINDLANRIAENQEELKTVEKPQEAKLLENHADRLNKQLQERIVEIIEENPQTIIQVDLPPSKQRKFQEAMREYSEAHRIFTEDEKPREVMVIEAAYLGYLISFCFQVGKHHGLVHQKRLVKEISLPPEYKLAEQLWPVFEALAQYRLRLACEKASFEKFQEKEKLAKTLRCLLSVYVNLKTMRGKK